jgi:hypothetical protein
MHRARATLARRVLLERDRHTHPPVGRASAIDTPDHIAMILPDIVELTRRARWRAARPASALLALALLLAVPYRAEASLLSPEAEDTMAGIIAVAVLFIVPVVLIVVFWLVHIMPEKIAHKRHHPQFEAIRTLCLLSLAFGGLLWPLAWLWAYTKPVGYKLAYGTDKHPDYYKEHGLPEPADAAIDLRQRVSALEGRGLPAGELDAIRADLAALEARIAGSDVKTEVI